MMRRRGQVHILVPVCLVGWLLAAPPWTVAAEINPVRFVMPNGLTVLVIEEHSLPIVQIHALVRVGSAQDPPEKAGLANFVVSLLDEGTTSRTAGQIAEQIEFVGGSLQTRASEDFTMVSARVLRKDMDLGFELLADVLQHPAFAEAELERVRAQLLGQIQSEKDDPGQVAAKTFRQLVFEGHPYRWPVNGTEETLPHITRHDLQAFHAREYLPNQTILAVVGDLNADQVRTELTKHVGGWKRGPAATRPARPVHPIEKPVVRLIEKDLSQATIMLGHGSISRTNPDYYAFTVMNYILGAGGFSSRLMDSIRDNQGLAYSVVSMLDANLTAGAFFVNLQTRNEAANQALNGVLNELKGMRDGTVTDQELNDAKAYLMGSFPLRLDTTAKLAEILGLVEFFGLGLDYFTQYPRWIERVTKEDVQRVAKQYLHPDRYALVLVGNLAKAKIRQ
jgi:zinc protease